MLAINTNNDNILRRLPPVFIIIYDSPEKKKFSANEEHLKIYAICEWVNITASILLSFE